MFKKYEIVSIVGTDKVMFTKLDKHGKLLVDRDHTLDAGRIIRFANDKHFNMGMLLMTDDGAVNKDFVSEKDCLVNNFSCKASDQNYH